MESGVVGEHYETPYFHPRHRHRTVAGKFSIGGLCISAGGFAFVRGGLDILKIDKISSDSLCFMFQFVGLGTLFGGAKRLEAPPWRRDCTGTHPPGIAQSRTAWVRQPRSDVLKKTCWYNLPHSGKFVAPATKAYANVLGAQARV